MVVRGLIATLLALLLGGQFGCCCRGRCPWPDGRMWYGPECGAFYWHEWFSHPPECRDLCNCCGYYNGSANPWIRQGGPSMGPPANWPYDFEAGPGEAIQPTPAQEPTPAPREREMRPMPSEELPAEPMPREPSAAVESQYNEFGQLTSYAEPVESVRASRKLGALRRPTIRSW